MTGQSRHHPDTTAQRLRALQRLVEQHVAVAVEGHRRAPVARDLPYQRDRQAGQHQQADVAVPQAEQAATEIAGLRLPPPSTDALTPAEEWVARLAASGMTNQQVAAALVVGAKTVEAHLSQAYRKLGIHTRAELGAHMAQRDASPAAEGPRAC